MRLADRRMSNRASIAGALPMLLNRLDHEAPPNLEPLAEPPSATAKRFYYDTVGHNRRSRCKRAMRRSEPTI